MKNMELRLSLILTDADMRRLQFKEREGEKEIIADVHGMKCYQAKKFINNIINVIRDAVRLIIIHGYNHGTAIKNMINTDFHNPHVSSIEACDFNLGRTDILVAA